MSLSNFSFDILSLFAVDKKGSDVQLSAQVFSIDTRHNIVHFKDEEGTHLSVSGSEKCVLHKPIEQFEVGERVLVQLDARHHVQAISAV